MGTYDPPLPPPQLLGSSIAAPGSLPGRHVIAEFYGASYLCDTLFICNALRSAAEDAKATVLALHHHVFSPDGGVTAFALLAESHISIHTWPEQDYAALDIFMCGACDPLACLPALTKAFAPARLELQILTRGREVMSEVAEALGEP